MADTADIADVADNADVQDRVVDHLTARGHVLDNGKFKCGEPNCRAVMKNARHNISSHISKKHRPNSAYQQADTIDRRACGICNFSAINRHGMIAHIRTVHGFHGESAAIEAQYAITQPDDAVLIPLHQCE
ncbi:hypothetical protein F5Y11DRAFT_365883 [Daldinia sp. FL1419]|nr:hypothetical protein F5Y11DRAFT_365883 [Daldinia sp. FL1419]